MPETRTERGLVRTGPLHCPECVSEGVAEWGDHAGTELECGNCGERFEPGSALLRLRQLDTEASADSLALDRLAKFLFADPDTFPGGVDVCIALEEVLLQTGRGPAGMHHAERPEEIEDGDRTLDAAVDPARVYQTAAEAQRAEEPVDGEEA